MLRRLAYHSRASDPVSYAEAANIAAEASRNNALNAIFGLLLLRDGRFFQMLEGDAVALDELYARLLRDPRHRDLVIVLNERIEAPAFHSFAMPLFGEEDGDRLLARLGEESVPNMRRTSSATMRWAAWIGTAYPAPQTRDKRRPRGMRDPHTHPKRRALVRPS